MASVRCEGSTYADIDLVLLMRIHYGDRVLEDPQLEVLRDR